MSRVAPPPVRPATSAPPQPLPARAAIFKDGELWFRGFWKSRRDMERLVEAFSHGRYADPEFAHQCREALAAYDAFCTEEAA